MSEPVTNRKRIIHILSHSLARCGMPGFPSQWPKHHMWVPPEKADEATCSSCLGREKATTFSMTLTRTVHYSVEIEASSLEAAIERVLALDTSKLDEADEELSTSDHDWEED